MRSDNYTPFYFVLWGHLKTFKWMALCFICLMLLVDFMGRSFFIDQLANVIIIFLVLVSFARLKILNIVLSLFLGSIIGLEITYMIITGERISVTILNSGTDNQFWSTLAVSKPFIIKAMPLIFFLSFLFIKTMLEIKLFRWRNYLVILVGCLLLSVSYLYNNMVLLDKYNNNLSDVFIESFDFPSMDGPKLVYEHKYMFHKYYPLFFGDLFYLIMSSYELSTIKDNSFHDKWPHGIALREDVKQPKKVIVVLGESSVSTHYSLYGYPYITTPHLDDFYQNKTIKYYSDVISPATVTRDSLKLSLSYATPFSDEGFFEYKNIVEMAKMVGYNTIWISSASESGPFSGYVSAIQKSSDIYYDVTNHTILKKGEDLDLPTVLKSEYIKGKKQFIILHMQGSHGPYSSHYDEKDKVITSTNEFTDYDRTIHHTDRLLNELIKIIVAYDENTILYYFSDHGEIVNVGHGFVYDEKVIDQYRIPLITFQHKNTLDIEQLIDKYRGKDTRLNNLNSSYIISELLGFHVDDALVEQAQKNGEYVYHADSVVYKFDDIVNKKVLKNNKEKN